MRGNLSGEKQRLSGEKATFDRSNARNPLSALSKSWEQRRFVGASDKDLARPRGAGRGGRGGTSTDADLWQPQTGPRPGLDGGYGGQARQGDPQGRTPPKTDSPLAGEIPSATGLGCPGLRCGSLPQLGSAGARAACKADRASGGPSSAQRLAFWNFA